MMTKTIKSNQKDRTSYETSASNMLRDIIELIGIYDDYRQEIDYDNLNRFQKYYSLNVTYNGKARFHYYNKGLILIRELLHDNDIYLSRKYIKRMCTTYRNCPIRLPVECDKILKNIFNYVFTKDVLKYVFVNDILANCLQYSNEVEHYPSDCVAGIFGFIVGFIYHTDDDLYSEKYKCIFNKINKTLCSIVENQKLSTHCIRRN